MCKKFCLDKLYNGHSIFRSEFSSPDMFGLLKKSKVYKNYLLIHIKTIFVTTFSTIRATLFVQGAKERPSLHRKVKLDIELTLLIIISLIISSIILHTRCFTAIAKKEKCSIGNCGKIGLLLNLPIMRGETN